MGNSLRELTKIESLPSLMFSRAEWGISNPAGIGHEICGAALSQNDTRVIGSPQMPNSPEASRVGFQRSLLLVEVMVFF